MHSRLENPRVNITLLLCSERSGSNLLRCLLDAHTRVFAPNTMALGLLCADQDDFYRERDTEAWGQLLSEVCHRVNESAHYTGVSVEERELAESVPIGDTGTLYLYAYHKGMNASGAQRLVIKEHQAWRIVEFFTRRFPHSKILVQVRDPRDHAVSCKKLGRFYAAYHGSVPRAARAWTQDQREALRLREAYGAQRVRIHRYEDLVRQPHETLRGICEFLDLEWEESMLGFHVAQKGLRKGSKGYLHNMWANLDRPLTSRSVGQWKRSLGPCELRAIEREVGLLPREFGYEVNGPRGNWWARLACAMYSFLEAVRYSLVSVGIWLAWVVVTRDLRVPIDVVLGNAVRAHRPYERFRDRFGYRL